MYDVIVVGAGPAGSVTAKRCAEYGLNTLILEKKKLPRDKVCGGLVSPFAGTLIKQEFGDIPKNIFCKPPQIAGHVFHIIGADTQKFDNPEDQTWRRNLDFWMNQKAQAKGVEIWQESRFTGLKDTGRSYLVTVKKKGEVKQLEARFIVGADGTDSTVRKYLFPQFHMNSLHAYSEHYRADVLDVDKAYAHLFYFLDQSTTVRKQFAFFGAQFKDDVVVMHFTDMVGRVRQLTDRGKKVLAENFHFDINEKPLIKESCLVPLINDELVSHTFLPATRNGILVGDAGGLNVIEGLAPSIKSAISAAKAIIAATESKGYADTFYLDDIEPIIVRIKESSVLTEKVNKALENGGKALAKVFGEANYDSLKGY